MSNRMLSEEKSKGNSSMLMSSQDTTLLLFLWWANADIQCQPIQKFSNKSKWRNNQNLIKSQAPQKASKLILCKSQIVFKSQNKLAKAFRFKYRFPKELTSGVVYKFLCGLCNESCYGECVRHLNVRLGEHIGISSLD